MISFITKLEDFFKMNRKSSDGVNFDLGKRKLVIPKYQREYGWEDEQIEELIRDIITRDKFLGMIILDEKKESYEIVDGQQRITTLFLSLIALYNILSKHPTEQDIIMSYIKPYDEVILQNESIGDYLRFSKQSISIAIDVENDEYAQFGSFNKAYSKIESMLGNYEEGSVSNFRQKLFDSLFLILINNDANNTDPIEQVFLDINEKSKLLDEEDIFKGYCFKNYHDRRLHPELKDIWIKLKKVSRRYSRFGYSKLGQYLYHYLLITVSDKISEKLKIEGNHYLSGKSIDETKNVLNGLIEYGTSVLEFRDNIEKSSYIFDDLCPDAKKYENTDDYTALKAMTMQILDSKGSLLQKLPLMMLVYRLSCNPSAFVFAFLEFKRLITNLYIYAILFMQHKGRKSKDRIGYGFIRALNDLGTAGNIIEEAKRLRIESVSNTIVPQKLDTVFMFFFYSVIDFYDVNKNWITRRYEKRSKDTSEHFIVPQKGRRITWIYESKKLVIELENTHLTEYKGKIVNYLILPKELNEKLERADVISKIKSIQEYYRGSIPRHISIYIDHIEAMEEYRQLNYLKDSDSDVLQIVPNYQNFLRAYFSDEQQNSLLSKLAENFKGVFLN